MMESAELPKKESIFEYGMGMTPKIEEESLHCVCRQPDDGRTYWMCERCERWFHPECVGEKGEEEPDEYICVSCKDHSMGELSIKEEPLEDLGYEEMETFRDENIDNKRYPCPECGKGFDFKAHLRKHLRVHSGETPFVCNICKKGFKHVSHLKRHRTTHSLEKDRCDICGKDFYEIGQHMKTHFRKTSKVFGVNPKEDGFTDNAANIERVPCPFCSNTYATKRGLKRHLLTHGGIKGYICEYCDKKFYASCDLNVHLRIHLDLKPYPCKECDRSFRTVSQLNKHVKICQKNNVQENNQQLSKFGRYI